MSLINTRGSESIPKNCLFRSMFFIFATWIWVRADLWDFIVSVRQCLTQILERMEFVYWNRQICLTRHRPRQRILYRFEESRNANTNGFEWGKSRDGTYYKALAISLCRNRLSLSFGTAHHSFDDLGNSEMNLGIYDYSKHYFCSQNHRYLNSQTRVCNKGYI